MRVRVCVQEDRGVEVQKEWEDSFYSSNEALVHKILGHCKEH